MNSFWLAVIPAFALILLLSWSSGSIEEGQTRLQKKVAKGLQLLFAIIVLMFIVSVLIWGSQV